MIMEDSVCSDREINELRPRIKVYVRLTGEWRKARRSSPEPRKNFHSTPFYDFYISSCSNGLPPFFHSSYLISQQSSINLLVPVIVRSSLLSTCKRKSNSVSNMAKLRKSKKEEDEQEEEETADGAYAVAADSFAGTEEDSDEEGASASSDDDSDNSEENDEPVAGEEEGSEGVDDDEDSDSVEEDPVSREFEQPKSATGEPCTFDLRNLLAVNTHQINTKTLYSTTKTKNESVTIPSMQILANLNVDEEQLLEKATDGCTQLIAALWQLPTERSSAGPMVHLPSFDDSRIPRALVSFVVQLCVIYKTEQNTDGQHAFLVLLLLLLLLLLLIIIIIFSPRRRRKWKQSGRSLHASVVFL